MQPPVALRHVGEQQRQHRIATSQQPQRQQEEEEEEEVEEEGIVHEAKVVLQVYPRCCVSVW